MLLDDISDANWASRLFLMSGPSTPALDLLSRSKNVHVMPVPFLWDDAGTWAGRAQAAEYRGEVDGNNNTQAPQGRSFVFVDAERTFSKVPVALAATPAPKTEP
jgi:hypothetical protein